MRVLAKVEYIFLWIQSGFCNYSCRSHLSLTICCICCDLKKVEQLRLKITDTPEANKCTRWTSGSCHRSWYHIGGRAKSSSSISEIVSELLYFHDHTVHQHDFICKSLSIRISNQTFPISTNAWLNRPWSRSMKISCQTVSISIPTLQKIILNFRSTSWYAQSYQKRAPALSSSIPPSLGETSSQRSEENYEKGL